MKKEIADIWVKELRSGKYKQGKGYLRQIDDKYCCLGVLCDIAIQHKQCPDWNQKTRFYVIDPQNNFNIPPINVKKWAELSLGLDSKSSHCLWRMNDEYNKSFEEIAYYIEKYWKFL